VKIRQRLALRFTLVSALVTGAILIFIYFFTMSFAHADFVDRLTQQSSLEVLHFASPEVRDVMPAGSFSLVNPAVSIYMKDRSLVHQTGSYPIAETWITFLSENDVFNAERGEYTTVGRKHEVNGKLYLVFVSDKDLPGQRELNFLFKALVAGWIISLVLSYLTGLYFSGNALQTVKVVVEEVKMITEDNLGYRLHVKRDDGAVDEIDELIITFNALLSRIERAFIAQRRFVQNASHELKTPLTAIIAEVELALARTRTVNEYKRILETVMSESERLARTTHDLLTLARLEEGSLKTELDASVNFSELIDQTLATFKLHHPDREVVLLKEGNTQGVFIPGNVHLLQTALLNILDNANKYSSSKIVVTVSCNEVDACISIQDFGIGIPAAELDRIRSPLFRASNVSTIPGAGLGLSLVDSIVRIHKGTLEIDSKEGVGTQFEIRLSANR